MALALVPSSEDRTVMSIDSIQRLSGTPDINSSFAKYTKDSLGIAGQGLKLMQVQSSGLFSLEKAPTVNEEVSIVQNESNRSVEKFVDRIGASKKSEVALAKMVDLRKRA